MMQLQTTDYLLLIGTERANCIFVIISFKIALNLYMLFQCPISEFNVNMGVLMTSQASYEKL